MRSPRPERHPGAANAVLVLSSRSVFPIWATAGAEDLLDTPYRYRKRVRQARSSRGIPPFDFERPFCGVETVTGRASCLAS
jgi:hypothetical protein